MVVIKRTISSHRSYTWKFKLGMKRRGGKLKYKEGYVIQWSDLNHDLNPPKPTYVVIHKRSVSWVWPLIIMVSPSTGTVTLPPSLLFSTTPINFNYSLRYGANTPRNRQDHLRNGLRIPERCSLLISSVRLLLMADCRSESSSPQLLEKGLEYIFRWCSIPNV